MLIQTKLHLPQINADFVKRPFLVQRLNQNSSRHFTLVAAPAGFGKTTLIASWLADQSSPYAWLSLDEFDNDLSLFLQYMTAAIQRVLPTACATLARILHAPDLPTDDQLAAIIINGLSQLSTPVKLVLDDYHLINNIAILRLIGRIVEQSQHQLHLIIISRIDPLLPLPRLRLQQTMVEIRQQDLRFSDEEATRFLQTAVSTSNQKPPLNPLDNDTIIRLNKRVEGWVAGLRMASFSMNEVMVGEDGYGDMNNFVADYLFVEVLAQQSSTMQHFLLQTAVLDRFSADLCDAIVDLSVDYLNSQVIISQLRNANLFIVPLDDGATWFRYHHLFQQLLQQRAATTLGEGAVRALHNRAGDWFAEQGHVDEALRHYLAADEMQTAVLLIEKNSRNLLNGLERHRLEQWLELLPEEMVWQRPRLLITKAWLLYRHWKLHALVAVLDQLQHSLAENGMDLTASECRFIDGQMNVFQSVIAHSLFDDTLKSIAAAERALSQLPASEQGAMGTAMGYWSLSMQAEGRGETAVSRLQQAIANPAPLGPAVMQLYLSLSFMQLADGDLLALKQTLDQFTALTRKVNAGEPAACWVSGIYHYEINQLDVARLAFEKTVSLHYSTNFLAAFGSWLALVRICQDQGDFAEAQTYLDAVRRETLRLNNQELLPIVEAVQAYQAYMEGETLALSGDHRSSVEVAACLRWARIFDPEHAPEWILLTVIPLFLWVRILTTHGTADEIEVVERILQAKLTIAQSRHSSRHTIQLLAHLALVQQKRGGDGAHIYLKQAIRMAERGGFIHTFIECGTPLHSLLQQLQQQTGDDAVAPHYLAQLIAAFPASTPTENGAMATLLTSRELEILQVMQTNLSNKEIAKKLVISIHTVKRHTANIYLKLGVNDRRTAVYQAQREGIL